MNINNKNNIDTTINDYKTIKVPSELLEFVKQKLGAEVLWVYDDETNELFLIKKPESFTDALSGLGEDMWKSVGGTDYIRLERESWEN